MYADRDVRKVALLARPVVNRPRALETPAITGETNPPSSSVPHACTVSARASTVCRNPVLPFKCAATSVADSAGCRFNASVSSRSVRRYISLPAEHRRYTFRRRIAGGLASPDGVTNVAEENADFLPDQNHRRPSRGIILNKSHHVFSKMRYIGFRFDLRNAASGAGDRTPGRPAVLTNIRSIPGVQPRAVRFFLPAEAGEKRPGPARVSSGPPDR